MKTERIEAIETLRGLACLFVFFSHVVGTNVAYGLYLNGCGKIGVWLFILTSGFLSFLPFLADEKKIENYGIKSVIVYWINKLKKIFPVYMLSLILAYVLGFFRSIYDVGCHIFCIEGTMHFWYMPVIMKFYLIFPIIVLIYKRVGLRIFSIVTSVSVCVLLFAFPYTEYQENSTKLYWYMPIFLFGILLSIIYTKHIVDGQIKWDIVAMIAFSTMIVLTPPMKKILFGIEPSKWLQNKYIIMSLLWGLIVLGVFWGKYTNRFLESMWLLKKIGNISLEFYLLHYIVLLKMASHIENTIILGAVVFIITIILGEFIHAFNKKVFAK